MMRSVHDGGGRQSSERLVRPVDGMVELFGDDEVRIRDELASRPWDVPGRPSTKCDILVVDERLADLGVHIFVTRPSFTSDMTRRANAVVSCARYAETKISSLSMTPSRDDNLENASTNGVAWRFPPKQLRHKRTVSWQGPCHLAHGAHAVL